MKYICTACGWIYDEASEKIPFDEQTEDYQCPICGVGKDMFEISE